MECADILELRQEESSYSNDTDDETKNDIPRATSSELTYNEFFWYFMKRNQPVVITNVSTDWECMKWTHLEDQKKQPALINNNNETVNINYNYLMEQIKNIDVPIADCNTLFYNSHKKLEMKFYDFLRHWQETRKKDVDVLNSNDETRATSDDLLYLKDWHLQAQMPGYKFYVVPKHFAADWLNEYLIETKRDDYRFVYMGPKGTWTPFHADVFGSFSWSTNVAGIKKWLFLPPGEEQKLQDKLGNLPLQIDIHTLDSLNIRHYILLQKEGEAIFVPSGWYHQVWNITDTISVNHNWFNACNLKRIWLNLASQMSKVIAEIQDCREMDNFDSHCQTMLRATFGINYLDFLDILEFIVEKRLATLKDANQNIMSSNYLVFNKYQLNDFHTSYDLRSVNEVVQLMAEDSIISENRVSLYRRCMQLLDRTKNI